MFYSYQRRWNCENRSLRAVGPGVNRAALLEREFGTIELLLAAPPPISGFFSAGEIGEMIRVSNRANITRGRSWERVGLKKRQHIRRSLQQTPAKLDKP